MVRIGDGGVLLEPDELFICWVSAARCDLARFVMLMAAELLHLYAPFAAYMVMSIVRVAGDLPDNGCRVIWQIAARPSW